MYYCIEINVFYHNFKGFLIFVCKCERKIVVDAADNLSLYVSYILNRR